MTLRWQTRNDGAAAVTASSTSGSWSPTAQNVRQLVMFSPPRTWHRSVLLPSFHGEQHIVLDPGWIMRESSMGEVKEKWAQYRTVVETRTLYYFRANNRGVNCPIPKRAFAPGDEAIFRSLAAARLDTKFRDPSPS